MARLWEDLRGQLMGEATEDWGTEIIDVAHEHIGPSAINLRLRDLTTKIREETKREPIPVALRWEIWERDNFTCRRCKARKFLTIDHIYPVARGGKTILSNLRTLCKTCKSKKHSKVVL